MRIAIVLGCIFAGALAGTLFAIYGALGISGRLSLDEEREELEQWFARREGERR